MRISLNVVRSNIFNPTTADFKKNILGFLGYNFFKNREIVINSAIFNVKKPELNMGEDGLIFTARLEPLNYFKIPKKLHLMVLEIGEYVSSVLTSNQEASISISFTDESNNEIDLAIRISIKDQ